MEIGQYETARLEHGLERYAVKFLDEACRYRARWLAISVIDDLSDQ